MKIIRPSSNLTTINFSLEELKLQWIKRRLTKYKLEENINYVYHSQKNVKLKSIIA